MVHKGAARKLVAQLLIAPRPLHRRHRPRVEQAPGHSEAPDDTYAETLEFLQRGMPVEEIAQVRDVKRQTVLRHMLVLADRGDIFDVSGRIQAPLLEKVRQAAEGWSYGEPLAPIKRQLRCTYPELKIHLAQILMERHAQAAE